MSTNASVSIKGDLYERDYQSWLERQAALLRAGRVAELDFGSLAEEIEDMGKRLKCALMSTLTVVMR